MSSPAEMPQAVAAPTRSIVVERQIPHPQEKVWRASPKARSSSNG